MDKQELQFFKEQSRNDLISFCVWTDRFFEVNTHHEIIADKLQAFMEGKIKRLILQTPPRSGKSRLVCESIAHAMGKLENTDIIYTGHSIGLLESFSRNIRGRIDSPEYKELFNARIKEGNSALNQWSTTNNNQLMIFGVGGGITGRGGHRLIIDDPYATRQDAESETIKERVFEWYNSTFYSRRHNQDTGICIIMQRWREDDLVGELLKQDEWEVVKIPAIQDGKSFWEDRFSVEELENIKKQIGSYFFESQYQQDPINLGGGDFNKDYFSYYDYAPAGLKIYTFVDPAISQKQESDYSAIVTIGVDPNSNNVFILDVFQEKVLPDRLIDEIFRIVKDWNPIKVGVEVVQFQKMLALELRNQMRLRNRYFTLEEITPRGEKEARIRTILQPRYSNHLVHHNREMQDLELQLLKFPNGKHDDMIDALSGAIAMVSTIDIAQKATPSKPKTYFNRMTGKMETVK